MHAVCRIKLHCASLFARTRLYCTLIAPLSAQRIGCCQLEMICAAVLHGLRMPVRSALNRKSPFSIR
jgi:hypothetical protein